MKMVARGSPRPLPPRVGRYEILLPIASGGMATVYLARSKGARGFERLVALKLTHAHLNESNDFAAVLLEEGNLAARIRHRNVVSVLDVGEDPLGLFLVMEYVEGDTLSSLRKTGDDEERMPVGVAMRILTDALAGLHAAHELTDEHGRSLNVVHRDFSPQNILVGVDGIAQLTDFGVAKAADRDSQTATGIVKGKIAYMSPEQAKGLPVDRRADVWAAGVVAWELLAGRRLHAGGEGVATLLKVVSERPPLLRTVVPDLPQELEAVVAAALEPDVDTRTPTAAAFSEQLTHACGDYARVVESSEVAAFVRRKAGAKLATRREQVQTAAKLRAKMDELASASMDAQSASSGSSSSSAATGGFTPSNPNLPSGSAAEAISPALPAPEAHAVRAAPLPRGASDPAVPIMGDDASLSSTAHDAGRRPQLSSPSGPMFAYGDDRFRSLVLPALVGVAVAILTLVLFVGFGDRRDRETASKVVAPPPSAVHEPTPPAASAAAEPLPDAGPSRPAASASSSAPAPAPKPRRPAAQNPPKEPPKNDCDPPYTLQDGVRVPKRYCL